MSNGNGPTTLTDWIQYLHAAAQEPKDSPYYAESRIEMAKAIRHINALQVAANQAGAQEVETGSAISGPVAMGAGLMHGVSLGTGEPISGLISSLTGGTFREGAQQYRAGLENVETQHPTLTPTAELLGPFALPAGVIGQGVGAGIKAGVPLTIGRGLGLLAKGAAAGAIPAGVAGFSGGGADPGDIQARLDAAKHAAIVGALLGAAGTGAAVKLTRGHVERAADLAQKGNQRALTQSRLGESQARLARMQNASPLPAIPIGETPAGLAARLRWGGGGTSSGPLPGLPGASGPPAPFPGAPQGLLGPEGISPPPQASYPPTLPEMQGYNLGRPGHPIWQGEGSPTTSAEVRGGEPLLPSANPAVAQALQRAPFAKLQAALRLPETPTPIKELILAELSRRGIVGPGLLAPR